MSSTYALKNHDLLIDDSWSSTGKRYVLRIKDMPASDKPRERLQALGPSALSVAELMAVLLVNGTKKEEVMAMSHRIIKEYGERTLTQEKDPIKLSKNLDIPIAKALQIVACAELGRRFYDRREYGPVVLRTAKDVFEYTKEMQKLPKEHLRGLYINTHHRVIHDEVISIGTIDTNLVHPREVFKPAIEYGAMAVLLVHNHPSGVVTPSEADIAITKHIAAAGALIGIPLIDHVIVGGETFISIEIE